MEELTRAAQEVLAAGRSVRLPVWDRVHLYIQSRFWEQLIEPESRIWHVRDEILAVMRNR